MKDFIKPLFEFMTSYYSLFDNPIYNYFLMAIVGVLAFIIAWKVVGSLYDDKYIISKKAGSIIHWVIRLIAFIIVFSFASIIIWIVKLILVIPIWLWIVILIVFLLIFLLAIFNNKFKKPERKNIS